MPCPPQKCSEKSTVGPAPTASARRAEALGFTFIELVVVLTLATILLGVAAPRLMEASASVAVVNARAKVSSAVSVARTAATRYGRVAYLVVDVAGDRIRVEVDTTLAGDAIPTTLHVLDLWSDLAVNLQASDPVVCFDPRGAMVTSVVCPAGTVVIRVSRGARADSLVVSPTGKTLP